MTANNNFRFGSKADIRTTSHVRFTPDCVAKLFAALRSRIAYRVSFESEDTGLIRTNRIHSNHPALPGVARHTRSIDRETDKHRPAWPLPSTIQIGTGDLGLQNDTDHWNIAPL